MDSWISPELISDITSIWLPRVVGALLTLVIGFWLVSRLTKLLDRAMAARAVDSTLRPFIHSLINIGLKVLVLLSVAGMFGLETTSFIAVLGAMAFAVGMALQGSLGHFASGVLILLFKPYKVGDVVEAGGALGVVKEIQIFNTILTSFDNQVIIVPNGVVTSGVIKNINALGLRRVDLTFGIGYSDNIDKARSVIQSVVDRCPGILRDKPVDIFVSTLNDSSVDFAVRPWAESADYWTVYFFLQEEIKKAFDREGISIPFPQMDMHLIRD